MMDEMSKKVKKSLESMLSATPTLEGIEAKRFLEQVEREAEIPSYPVPTPKLKGVMSKMWECPYCKTEVWGRIGQVIRINRKRVVAHQSCVRKERKNDNQSNT